MEIGLLEYSLQNLWSIKWYCQ